MLLDPDIDDATGRLLLKHDKDGKRHVVWRGIANISKQFWAPTLLLDATPPDLAIIHAYHPLAEKVAELGVELPPHVQVRQILRSPTSAYKLNRDYNASDKRREEIWRYI